ncbi:CapA family protein [Ornithinimicrobium sediminis]|uniref:CapA family protein n=1 Tax=Ornithinimicrobium sediminis TaxID=2904603 RepID=UPI0038CD7C41
MAVSQNLSAPKRPWLLVAGDTVLMRPSRCEPRLRELIRSADTAFANLEAPLTSRGVPAEKAATHRADPDCAQWLLDLGFTAVTLANNHALDYGPAGLEDTIQALRQAGIAHVGAGASSQEALAPLVTQTSSGSVAVIGLCAALPPGFAATDTRPGVAPLRVLQQVSVDPALAAEQPGMAPFVHTSVHPPDLLAACESVRRARESADVVIVAVHWGIPHGFAAPSYGPLAEYQQPVGRALIDAGATLVIGHHPHLVQHVERYAGGLIAYSVGNFMFHNWDRFSGQGPDQSAASTPAGAETGLFPLQIPSAPYRSSFGAAETLDSVVVLLTSPSEGPVSVQFVPTTMTNGDPVIPTANQCQAILDRLDRGSSTTSGDLALRLRTDLVPGAVVGEVRLNG